MQIRYLYTHAQTYARTVALFRSQSGSFPISLRRFNNQHGRDIADPGLKYRNQSSWTFEIDFGFKKFSIFVLTLCVCLCVRVCVCGTLSYRRGNSITLEWGITQVLIQIQHFWITAEVEKVGTLMRHLMSRKTRWTRVFLFFSVFCFFWSWDTHATHNVKENQAMTRQHHCKT